MALRDILVRWRMQVDNSGVKQAEREIDKLNTSVERTARTFAGLYGLGRLGSGLFEAVQMASDTIETMNVLNQTFKTNANEVVGWSKTTAKALGRSEFALQKTAGQFGSFLAPQGIAGSQLSDMSEKLTVLAADLASFYNISDEESQMRLFSGMAGETEAVRRLGIDLSAEGLQQEMINAGDNRKFTKLSLQEKTQIRYNKLLKDTVDKQGDILRTYDEWENTWKRFKAETNDIVIEFGKRLIPVAKEIVKELSGWLPVLSRVGGQSRFLESSFEALGAMVGTVALQYAWQNRMMSAGLLAAGGLFLVFDEMRTMFSDGPSDTILGDFAENILGIDNPAKKFQEGLQEVIGTLDVFAGALMDLVMFLPKLPELFIRTLRGEDTSVEYLAEYTNAAMRRAGQNQRVQEAADAARPEARLQAAGSGDIAAFRATYKNEQITDEQLRNEFLSYRKRDINRRFANGETMIPTAADVADGLVPTFRGFGSAASGGPTTSPIPAGAPMAPGSGAGISAPTVININGGDPVEVQRRVEAVMDARNRRLQAALSRTAYTGTDAAF